MMQHTGMHSYNYYVTEAVYINTLLLSRATPMNDAFAMQILQCCKEGRQHITCHLTLLVLAPAALQVLKQVATCTPTPIDMYNVGWQGYSQPEL